MADRVGFEPTVPFRGTHDFQSCAFDHSAIYPIMSLNYNIPFLFATNFFVFLLKINRFRINTCFLADNLLS